MPMRHGGSALKNASTWLRRSCLRSPYGTSMPGAGAVHHIKSTGLTRSRRALHVRSAPIATDLLALQRMARGANGVPSVRSRRSLPVRYPSDSDLVDASQRKHRFGSISGHASVHSLGLEMSEMT